jgi:hypothetical protein
MTTVPSWQRGRKRGRGAEEDGDDDAAARGSPRRAAAIAGAPTEMEAAVWKFGTEVVEPVPRWSNLIDVDGAKMGSDQYPVDVAAAAAAPDMAELLSPAAGLDAPAMYEGGGVRAHPYGWDLPFPFPLHYDSKFAAAADLSLGTASPEDDAIVDGFAAAAAGDYTSVEFVAGGSAKMGSVQDPVDAAAAPAPGTMAELMAALLRPAARPDASALHEDGGLGAYCGWDLPLLFPHHYDVEKLEFLAIAAAASSDNDAIVDGFAAAVTGDATSTEFGDGGAPEPDTSSDGPFGFDLNQQLSSNVWDDEGSLVVPGNAVVDGSSAAAADGGGGSVEVAAEDGATARRSSRGFDLDLNQPCPTETEFPDGEPDRSDVLDPAPAPVPVEDSLAAAPQADEPPPELPDGGAPASPTLRRRSLTSRLWDWAFEWTNGLALAPGLKRSRS